MVETEEDPQDQTNQNIVENEEEEDDANQGELEAWIWILGGIALAVFAILTFIFVHPEAPPPEGGGQFSAVVRVVVRIALFLCGCVLARNGFKLLKK